MMKQKRKINWPLILAIPSVVILFIGYLFKIRHWPAADELMTLGKILIALCVLMALFRLLLSYRKK